MGKNIPDKYQPRMFVSGKRDFRTRRIPRDTVEHFIMVKGSIHPEELIN